MLLNAKSLEKLRILINEETTYRSGPQLVSFFHQFGFNDVYGQGFPSRWMYTDNKLSKLNGSSDMDKCIRTLFDPINYIGRFAELDSLIEEFNQYLAFDGWQVVRNNREITFCKAGIIDIDKRKEEATITEEQSFLGKNYFLDLNRLNLQSSLIPIMESRIDEIRKSMANKLPLASIFLSGSTLEGVLLNLASTNPRQFNLSNAAPKNKENKVKMFSDWTLNNLIDVAFDLGYIKEDVKQFSHVLRDFRNYIHPFEQMSRNFFPDIHTAEICFQVLKAAIYQIGTHKIS